MGVQKATLMFNWPVTLFARSAVTLLTTKHFLLTTLLPSDLRISSELNGCGVCEWRMNMEGEVANIKKWIVLYPIYINSKKTVAEGRRIAVAKACENPTCVEIGDCCAYLKLPYAIEVFSPTLLLFDFEIISPCWWFCISNFKFLLIEMKIKMCKLIDGCRLTRLTLVISCKEGELGFCWKERMGLSLIPLSHPVRFSIKLLALCFYNYVLLVNF